MCIQGSCFCRPGYMGATCELRRCPNDCSGRGRCALGDDGLTTSCECNPGWTGPSCEERMCPARCSNHGYCSENATCVCDAGTQGYISSDQNPEPQLFRKNCSPEPYGDLVRLHNPTCWLETYAGGLHCCKSGNILLNKGQDALDKACFSNENYKKCTPRVSHLMPVS